ncbi:MAG: hypothetical protein KBS75_03185 [Bacteroidales bacterium]|nr:hypothetical protein [Candidatus Equimonas faecalis]
MKKILALLVFALTLLVPSAVAQTTYEPVVYPAQQTAVGNAALSVSNGTYTFSNNLFSASFVQTGDQIKFGGCSAMSLKAGTELFTVTFGDGTTVKASQLTSPVVTSGDLTGNDKAVKGSDHYNGKYLQAVYTYTKGEATLTLTWRAELRDGSHYLRTDLTVRSNKDIAMKSFVPMQYIYDTTTGGTAPEKLGNVTYGNLLMNDKIFAGLETPMGKNSVGDSDGETYTAFPNVSGWTKDLMTWTPSSIPSALQSQNGVAYTAANYLGTQGLVTFSTSGSVTATFQYQNGACGLWVAGIELVNPETGTVESSNYNLQFTGGGKQQISYTLANVVADKVYLMRFYYDSKKEGAANRNTSNGNITWTSAPTAYTPTGSGAADKYIKGLWSRNTTLYAYAPDTNGELGKDMEWNVSTVVGLVNPAQKRRSYLAYHERERAVPWRPFPLYNSWYELNINRKDADDPANNMTTAQAVGVVNQWKEHMYNVYGEGIQAYVWDDGWDQYGTWEPHANFTNGFAETDAIAKTMNTGIGCWLGPRGGYGHSADLRRKYWTDKGSSHQLSQPDFFKAFMSACSEKVKNYDFRFFKFDGISTLGTAYGPQNEEDAEGIITVERLARKMREDLFFNTTVGTWASPFWFHFADAIWRQENDHGTIGTGANNREQWITYRDNLVHTIFTAPNPYCPINSIMTHGFILSTHGGSSDRSYNSVLNELRCAFCSGDAMVELYADADLLNTINGGILWEKIAECIKWQKDNADVLPDIHWVGGDPWDGSNHNIYGWASWNGTKATLTLRNGDPNEKTYTTTLREALDIPSSFTGKIYLKAAFGDQFGALKEICDIDDNTAIDPTQSITFTLPGSSVYVFNGKANAPVETVLNTYTVTTTDMPNDATVTYKGAALGSSVSAEYINEEDITVTAPTGYKYTVKVDNVLHTVKVTFIAPLTFESAIKDGATYAFVNIQPTDPRKTYYLYSDGTTLKATSADACNANTEWPTSAQFVAIKQEGENKYAFKNVANDKYLAWNAFASDINTDLSVWTAHDGKRSYFTDIHTFWFGVNKRSSGSNQTGTIILKNDGNLDKCEAVEFDKNTTYSNNFGLVLVEDVPLTDIEKAFNYTTNSNVTATQLAGLTITFTGDNAANVKLSATQHVAYLTPKASTPAQVKAQNGKFNAPRLKAAGETPEGIAGEITATGETGKFSIAFPEDQITEGDYEVTIPAGTFYVGTTAHPVAELKANYTVEESAPATETVLARMTDLVGGGTNHDGVVSTEWSTDVEKGAVYDFTASNSYVGAINNSAIATALNDGTNYITVAAWVYGNGTTSQSNIFGYGGGSKGVKFNINGSTLKTTTKNVKDFPNQAASLQENQWNLIAYTIPEKSNTSATQYAYYAGTSTGTRYLKDGYSSSSGWAYNVPATQQFSIASANCDGASECYSGLIANLTVIESNDFMTYEKLYSLVGPAPTASATPDPYDGKTFIIRHANPAQATKHLAIADDGEKVVFSTRNDGLEAWTFEATGTPGQYKLSNPNIGYLKNTANETECTLDFTTDGEAAAIVAIADYTPTSGQATAGLTGVVTLTNTATNKQLFNNAEANAKAYFGYGAATASNSWGCQFIIEEYVAPSELLPTFEAQAPNAITSGWYQIKWDDTDSDSKTGVVSSPNGKFVKNYDTDITVSDKAYPLYLDTENGVPATADESAKTYVYVDRANANVGTVASIRSANGHYVSIDGSASIAEAKNLYLIFRSQGSKPKGTVVSSGTGGNRNSWLPIEENGDKYIGQGSQNKFPVAEFSPVDLATIGLTEYTVNVEGTTSPVQVSYSGSDNKGLDKVYDNGTFFFTTGATPTTEQFSAPQVSGSYATITVDGTNHTITVTYSIVDDITEQITYDRLDGNTWTKWAESAWAGSVPTDITALDNTNYTEANLRVISKKYEFEAGENLQATFQYVAEGHTQRTDIVGVDIVDADGNVVLSDYHNGYTGGHHSLNVYTLNNIPAGIYTVRYITSARSSDGANINTGGTITNVITVGQMPVGGHVYTIYNDHSDVAYYLQNNTEGYTQISTDAAEGDANKWIVWGDNTTGIQIYNLANKHLFTTKDGTLLDIKNVNAQVGVTIYNHGTNTTQAGNKASGALRVNDHYTNGYKANEDRTYSTDFVFIPTGQFAYHVESYGELTGLTVNIKGVSHNIGDFYITDTELTEADLESVGENTKVVLDGYAIRLDKKCTYKVNITENEKGATAVLYNGESKSDGTTFEAFISEVNAENFETAYDYLSQTTAITPNTTDDAVDYDVTTTYTVLYHPTWRTDGIEGHEGVTRALKPDGETKYMIFDTATQNTDNWAGFMYPKGNKVGKTSPCTPLEYKGPEIMLWTVEDANVETGDGYYLKNVGTGKYYDGYGNPHDSKEESAIIYIQMFPEATMATADSTAHSVNRYEEPIVDIKDDKGCWAIGASREAMTVVGNGPCWNGGKAAFNAWWCSSPFAFYEICELEDNLNNTPEIKDVLIDYCQYFEGMNDDSHDYRTYQEKVEDARDLDLSGSFTDYVAILREEKDMTVKYPQPVEIDGQKYGRFITVRNAVNLDYLKGNSVSMDRAVMWLNADNELVSYDTGLGYSGTDAATAIAGGKNFSVLTLSEVSPTRGTLVVKTSDNKYLASGGDREHGTSYTSKTEATATNATTWYVDNADYVVATIPASGYTTFYAPVPMQVPEEDVTAYTIVAEEGKDDSGLHICTLTLTTLAGGQIPAGTAVVLQGNQGSTRVDVIYGEEDGKVDESTYADIAFTGNNVLKGYDYTCTNPQTSASGGAGGKYIYTLSNGKFQYYTGSTIKAFKCFLELTQDYRAGYNREGVATNPFRIIINDETTGISGTKTSSDNNAFDLSGRRINVQSERGLYILNGKKVIR